MLKRLETHVDNIRTEEVELFANLWTVLLDRIHLSQYGVRFHSVGHSYEVNSASFTGENLEG